MPLYLPHWPLPGALYAEVWLQATPRSCKNVISSCERIAGPGVNVSRYAKQHKQLHQTRDHWLCTDIGARKGERKTRIFVDNRWEIAVWWSRWPRAFRVNTEAFKRLCGFDKLIKLRFSAAHTTTNHNSMYIKVDTSLYRSLYTSLCTDVCHCTWKWPIAVR